MKGSIQKKILFLGFFLGAFLSFFSFFIVQAVWTDSSSGEATINFSVSSVCGNGTKEEDEGCDDGNIVSGDGCSSLCANEGGGGAGTDNQPVISAVASTVTQTTAAITWQASDDHSIQSLSFAYGLTVAYGPIEPVAVSQNGNYSKNLIGLLQDTTYYFKITATDNAGQSVIAIGSFKTIAPLPPDTTAPVISNVASVPGITTCQITWDTGESSNSQVLYGLNNTYGSTGSDVNFVVSHVILLNGLLPNTVYHYKIISADALGNSANTADAIFTTQKDNTPPSNVATLALSIVGGKAFKLDWTNPALAGDNADFAGVKIARKVNSASADVSDGALIYTGSGNGFTDNNVSKNVNYFYTVFSFDTSGNYSSGSAVSGLIPSAEICSNQIDDDADGKIDCADLDCSNHPFCQPIPQEVCNDGLDNDNDGKTDCVDTDCAKQQSCQPLAVEICNDSVDNDNDGKLDCQDADCVGSAFCNIPSKQEICNNNQDDDADNKIDCADSDCAGFAGCGVDSGTGASGGTGVSYQCADDIDNDNDNFIDFPNDPGCVSTVDNDEYNPPAQTVPEMARLKLADVLFLAGKGKVILSPQGDKIISLAGSGFVAVVSQSILAGADVKLVLRVDGAINQFSFNNVEQKYYATVSFPAVGTYDAYLEADYGKGGFDSLAFKLQALAYGSVLGENDLPLAQAEVTLYHSDGAKAEMSGYGGNNPFSSNVNGNFGWVVPNGDYYLIIKKDGYHERKTNIYHVVNNTINFNLSLVKKTPKLEEVINPEASLQVNAVNVAKNLIAKTKETTALVAQKVADTAEVAKQLADDPQVEQVSKQVVAPVAVSAVAVSTLSFLSLADLLPFLRLLFLQPLFLLGRRKREKWGQIYSALDKMPIDLAMVRLVDAETNQVKQSKVTDKRGRYAFVAGPGKYRLEVQKSNFIFPSALLNKFKNDGRRADIYHGEIIEVAEEDSVITANIPVDVKGAEQKKPVRLLWNIVGQSVQSGVAIAGFLITLLSFYIAPSWYIGSLLAVHAGLSLVFKRLSKPIKPKGWGIVYDADNRKPVGKTIARLFNAKLDKLVASQITGKSGRYYFLAGDDEYYVTFEHGAYEPLKTDNVDLTGKEADTVAVDVGLRKTK